MALKKKDKFSHNKKRNTGLVYEFLIRKMSQSLIEENSRDYKKALALLKKYYNKGTPLYEEKQLFDAILHTEGASARVASGILVEVASAAKKLNYKIIDIKKSNLIKDINRSFGKSFFSNYRFAEYKKYASIQLLINGCNPKSTLIESVQKVKLEESLLKSMMYLKEEKIDEAPVDNFVYSIAIQKFNERYESLNESQKNLLSSYITSLAEDNGQVRLGKYLDREKKKLLSYLKRSHTTKEIVEDKIMLEKLKEAEALLENMSFKNAGSKQVEDLMLYCSLVQEMASDE